MYVDMAFDTFHGVVRRRANMNQTVQSAYSREDYKYCNIEVTWICKRNCHKLVLCYSKGLEDKGTNHVLAGES